MLYESKRKILSCYRRAIFAMHIYINLPNPGFWLLNVINNNKTIQVQKCGM